MIPRTLVFAGGGTRCLFFLPALVELEKRGYLKEVKECWGTSAGALIAAIYFLRKDAQKVYDIMFKVDFTKIRDIDLANILTINQSWGLDDGKHLVRMIEELLEDKKNVKMSEVPGLHIVVSDLTDNKTLVVNAKTFPDMRLTDAIRASMSMPFFLRPYIHTDGHIWVDGALRYNFAWNLLPNNEERKQALGFAFKKPPMEIPKSISQYMYSVLNFNDPPRPVYKHNKNIIWFDRPDFPSWYIKFKEEDYTLVLEQSVKTINSFISGLTPPQETTGTPPPSVDHYSPSQDFLTHRTVELLDTQKPSREPFQGSSPLQSPYTQPTYRRWSV